MRGEGPIAQLLGRALLGGGEAARPQQIRYRLDTLRFAVPKSARTALVDAKRDAAR